MQQRYETLSKCNLYGVFFGEIFISLMEEESDEHGKK